MFRSHANAYRRLLAITPNRESEHSLRLSYLDGLRGFAALYVVLHHCVKYATWGVAERDIPLWLNLLGRVFQYGHYSVVLFIVLSGYCLTLPVVQNKAQWFSGGLGRYFRRRACRILPPYYASLLLALALIYGVEFHRPLADGAHWRDWLPVTAGGVLSHLFLVHNFNSNWWDQINGPVWTVATEWHLYFALPVLILLWRRFNLATMLLTALLVGLGVHFVAPWLDKACYWFLASFAFGVAAAAVGFDPTIATEKLADPVYRAARWGLCALLVVALSLNLPEITYQRYLIDTIVGATIALFLLEWTRQTRDAARERDDSPSGAPILRLLQSPLLLGLGQISYSLYLVHGPILNSLQNVARDNGLSPSWALALVMGLGVPLSLGVGALFYRLAEAPSLRLRDRRVASAAESPLEVSK